MQQVRIELTMYGGAAGSRHTCRGGGWLALKAWRHRFITPGAMVGCLPAGDRTHSSFEFQPQTGFSKCVYKKEDGAAF